jgi:hypothetical protein
LAKNIAFNTLAFFVRSLVDIAYKIKVFITITDFIREYMVSFIKRAITSVKAPSVLVVKLF